uniref:WAT1-related protein n=1 Tax=Quercus lobata TaxID=97700 RepID=A0A7N2LGX1_QUELO
MGLLGSVLATTLYYAGLEYTSSTFTAVTGNLLPSITFLLAILCRMEKLDISQRGAQAKIVGTVVAFAGATLMTLYKGIVVVSLLPTQHSHQTFTSKASLDQNWLKGSFMLVISNLSYSAFYILQNQASKDKQVDFMTGLRVARKKQPAHGWKMNSHARLSFSRLFHGVNCGIWKVREDKAHRSQLVARAWRAQVHWVD